MRARWASLIWPALALLGQQSCGVDDRGLSFRVSALGSASSQGSETARAGEPGRDQGGNSASNGGTPTSAGSENDPAGGVGSSVGGTDGEPGGAPDGGTPTGGAPPNRGGSNSGGSGSGPEVEPGNFPCGNLNRNDADDCAETLVQNSRFDVSATGWESEGSLLQTWKVEDARGAATSGSLSLTNTNVVPNGTGKTGLASHQCFAAWSGDEYELGARVRIQPGQGSGDAGLNVIFYGGDACEGDVLGGRNVAFTSDTGKWIVVRDKLSIPAGSRSARVRLMLAKPFDQASFEAQFDDVLVVKL
jgi:hypothetical protein